MNTLLIKNQRWRLSIKKNFTVELPEQRPGQNQANLILAEQPAPCTVVYRNIFMVAEGPAPALEVSCVTFYGAFVRLL